MNKKPLFCKMYDEYWYLRLVDGLNVLDDETVQMLRLDIKVLDELAKEGKIEQNVICRTWISKNPSLELSKDEWIKRFKKKYDGSTVEQGKFKIKFTEFLFSKEYEYIYTKFDGEIFVNNKFLGKLNKDAGFIFLSQYTEMAIDIRFRTITDSVLTSVKNDLNWEGQQLKVLKKRLDEKKQGDLK